MAFKPVHLLYLLIYIGTGSAFTLFVKGSQSLQNGRLVYRYEPIIITLAVEFLKLFMASVYVLFLQTPETRALDKLRTLLSKAHVARLFAIPAGLYFLFNAGAFFNLNLVQPATYRLLINLKVLFSGLMLQWIIGTKLTGRQWFALFLLLLACGIEQIDSFDFSTGLRPILQISAQAMCSSAAGVYFQGLLQSPSSSAKEQAELGLWEKNVFMYCWSVLFNILYLFVFAPNTLFNLPATLSTLDFNAIPIILTSAIGGFSTSLILRDLDVIVKEYANFVEMCVVVIGSFLFLGAPLHVSLFVAVGLVTVSLYMYNVPSDSSSAPAAGGHGGYAPVAQQAGSGSTGKTSEEVELIVRHPRDGDLDGDGDEFDSELTNSPPQTRPMMRA